MLLINKGRIITLRQRPDGKQKGIRLLESGSILGLTQIFYNRESSTNAYVQSDLEGCLFSTSFIESLCLQIPDFAKAIIGKLSRSFHESINHIEHLSLDTSTEKLSFILNTIENNDRLDLTHHELALLTGMNRVTVTRAIKSIRKDK